MRPPSLPPLFVEGLLEPTNYQKAPTPDQTPNPPQATLHVRTGSQDSLKRSHGLRQQPQPQPSQQSPPLQQQLQPQQQYDIHSIQRQPSDESSSYSSPSAFGIHLQPSQLSVTLSDASSPHMHDRPLTPNRRVFTDEPGVLDEYSNSSHLHPYQHHQQSRSLEASSSSPSLSVNGLTPGTPGAPRSHHRNMSSESLIPARTDHVMLFPGAVRGAGYLGPVNGHGGGLPPGVSRSFSD